MSRFIVIALVLASLASVSSALNCSYGSSDYFVPAYDSAKTAMSGSALYFVVTYNKAAFSAVGSFDGGNSSCSFVSTNSVDSVGCNNSLAINMSISAGQFANCGFSVASGATSANYRGRFKLTTVEQAGVLRSVVFNRTVESAILFDIAFATVVNATSGNVSVYGAVAAQAAITSQLFDTTSYSSALEITTSVQYPYILSAAVGQGNSDTKLTLSVASTSVAGCSSALTNACFQVFRMNITSVNACQTNGASNLNHDNWKINFTVSCDTSRINCTGQPAPGSVLVTFSTGSPDFCPVVLGTITPTLSVAAYDGQNLIPQTFFVWGAKSYFRAVLSSPVLCDGIRVTRSNLAAGGVANLGDLYLRAYDSATASAFWSADVALSTTGTSHASFHVIQCSTEPSLNPSCYFTIDWSDANSAATGDNPQDTIVYVEARIKYTGSSGSAERIIRQKVDSLDAAATPSSMGARAQVGVIQSETTPVSTAARSSSSSNLAIIAVASVGGAIAVLSVFAIVAIKRRRNSKEQQEKMESVYLSRLETPASTTA